VHSTGTGLGWKSTKILSVAKGQKQILEPGNVVPIDPGGYVPGSVEFGSKRRAVHEGRTEVLTAIPRDRIEIYKTGMKRKAPRSRPANSTLLL